MRVLILTFIFFHGIFLGQNICEKDFLYENLIYKNNNIDLKENYNSSTGEYSFVYCGTEGVQRNINFNVKLTNEEKEKFKKSYLDLNINNKVLCTEVRADKLFAITSISYNFNKKQECAKNDKEKADVLFVKSLFLEIIREKKEYKEALYWKFIKR
ncbi:hypothetical protein [Chryseobacterium sp. T20]|uniref:hypothetical protein n=1 Tax=Chryseobacterium sp. T20 TaxID=3395375 RepID=UPI0039BCEA48